MYIYLDVIWLLNFCFDGLLLLLTAMILKRSISKWRIFFASLIGSSIVLLAVSPWSTIGTHPIIKLLFSLLIIWVAFGFKRFRYFIQGLLTFYFTTFMVGGGMIGVHYFLESELEIFNGVMVTNTSGFGNPISWGFVLIGFPLIWYFSKNRIDDIEMKKISYDQIVKVSCFIDDVSFDLRGLIDSGNQLYDPITKTPVMIIESSKVEGIFPPSIIEQSKNVESWLTSGEFAGLWENRIRIIPYRGIGQDHQFLLAIKPDFVTVLHNNELIKVKKVLLAINQTTLSTDGDYECIVHPKMLVTSNIPTAS